MVKMSVRSIFSYIQWGCGGVCVCIQNLRSSAVGQEINAAEQSIMGVHWDCIQQHGLIYLLFLEQCD